MSIQLLIEYLHNLGFSEKDYAVGADQENRMCLVKEDTSWVVFFSERGSRWDDITFDSEKVACTYFLGLFAQRHIEENKQVQTESSSLHKSCNCNVRFVRAPELSHPLEEPR